MGNTISANIEDIVESQDQAMVYKQGAMLSAMGGDFCDFFNSVETGRGDGVVQSCKLDEITFPRYMLRETEPRKLLQRHNLIG